MRRHIPRAGAICKDCGKPPGFCDCKRKPHSLHVKPKDGDGLIRYPVPILNRTAYLELPRNLTAGDVARIHDVMTTLVNSVTPPRKP